MEGARGDRADRHDIGDHLQVDGRQSTKNERDVGESPCRGGQDVGARWTMKGWQSERMEQ
jgi:hypothetical protein